MLIKSLSENIANCDEGLMIGQISDRRIKALCNMKYHVHRLDLVSDNMCPVCNGYPMIEPFVAENVRHSLPKPNGGLVHDLTKVPIISYGLSSYGYDMRVASEFKIFTNLHAGIVDPKNFDSLQFHEVITNDYVIIPPNAFALARSVEYFRIPKNVIGIVLGKSTYARCGLICNITAMEPGWEGTLTIELSNTAPLPLKVYANEGIAQAIFFEADEECEVSYADKHGKYMHQRGITFPKV